MTQQPARLLIVYNADSGIINALMHAVHKQVRPETYPCSLCALTYGAVSMRGEWKAFLGRLPMDVVFHHRDDFAEAYPDHEFPLPAILTSANGKEPQILISAEELDAMTDAAQLIARVEDRLVIESLYGPRLRVVA
ncbi:hypothetical protein [uncultured Erythrobacter sp.]|uniref:hypothetical protein n=1 Tax=uncultured Erythrobacter sp. TaxID=263913 RepID=UPI00261F9780|nr:hypothetical protein [uncultured Erythrobacter sp.]